MPATARRRFSLLPLVIASVWTGSLFLLFVSACAHVEPKPCAADRDCKLNRLCDAGRCVWPADSARASVTTTGPAALPMPQYALEPAQAMFRLGATHRGRSPFVLPATKPSVWWTYQASGPIFSSPSLAADGSVLVGSQDGKLYAIARDGGLKWSYATGDMIFSSPAVAHDGTIYIGSDDDHLYAVTPGASAKPRWILQMGSCPQRVGIGPEASRCDVDAGPTIGPDGVIYTGGDGIYAINPDGTLRWHFVTGGHVASAPALLPDGTVVAGCRDDLLYAIAPNGQKKWDFRAGADIEASPAIGDDGTIYVGSDDNKLYAIAPDGALRWGFTTGDDVRASVAVGNGIVYVGSFDSQLYAVHLDGTLAWTFRAGDRIISSALVDSRGAILFGSQDDRLYCLEPDGHLRWSFELGGDVDSSPVLAADGTIFVGSDDRKLYALRPAAAAASGKP